jgi:hypothetical protein
VAGGCLLLLPTPAHGIFREARDVLLSIFVTSTGNTNITDFRETTTNGKNIKQAYLSHFNKHRDSLYLNSNTMIKLEHRLCTGKVEMNIAY